MSKFSALEFNENGVEFGDDLFHALNQTEKWMNIMISPLALRLTLGLTYLAVGPETRKEMVPCLRFPENIEHTMDRLARDLCRYIKDKHTHIACRIFTDKTLDIKSEALATFDKLCKVAVKQIDLTEKEKAAGAINKWVGKKTENKITEIVKPDEMDNTRIILVSVIYFNLTWLEQFQWLSEAEFWKNGKELITVDVMGQAFDFMRSSVIPELKCRSIEIPFEDQDHVMLIVLPDSRFGIDTLEAELPKFKLITFRERAEFGPMKVQIPKFRIEYNGNLVEPLTKMGMKTVFEQPDFCEFFSSPEKLTITKVLHKAVIDVGERVEATAGTNETATVRNYSSSEIFFVSHPFLFAIMSKYNRLLFLGTVRDPTCATMVPLLPESTSITSIQS